MVNTGKPSPGCFACRTRRIKVSHGTLTPVPPLTSTPTQCDTTRPECRKCRKRGWKCPGYRDLNALRIVDETQKQFTRFSADKDKDDQDAAAMGSSQGVIIRQYAPPTAAHATTTRRSPKRASSTATSVSTVAASSYPSPISQASSPNAPSSPLSYKTTQTHCSSDDIPRCVGPNMAEHVFAYFLQNFVQGSALRNHGYLDFLFPLLANNPPGERGHPLPLAFTAAAMISFAARQKVPELLPKAEAIYLRALESTFLAIGDSSRARDNSTLACVTLLTTFEVCLDSSHLSGPRADFYPIATEAVSSFSPESRSLWQPPGRRRGPAEDERQGSFPDLRGPQDLSHSAITTGTSESGGGRSLPPPCVS